MKQDKEIYREEAVQRESPFVIYEGQVLTNTSMIMHYHNVIEIGIAEKGSGIFLINGSINHFNEGDVSIIFPNNAHISCSNPDDESVWTYLLIDIYSAIKQNPYILSVYDGALESRIFSMHSEGRIAELVKKLCAEQRYKPRNYEKMSEALCAELLIEISRSCKASARNVLKEKELYEKISSAMLCIASSYDEDITVKKLAKMCFMSETHFRRTFKAATGVAPLEYLYRTRISAAESLIKANEGNMTEICRNVGYCSQTSFNKHFKRYAGVTPSEFKKGLLKNSGSQEKPKKYI